MLTFHTTSHKKLGRKPPSIPERAITTTGFGKAYFPEELFQEKDFINFNRQ